MQETCAQLNQRKVYKAIKSAATKDD